MFSILLFSKSYLSRDSALQESIISGYTTAKLGVIEDDVLSNAFNELLTTRLGSINRGVSIDVNFNFSELTSSRDYAAIMSSYETYIENTYASKINTDISLDGFNNTFKIQPYDTIYEINGQTLYLYFLAPYTDINSITIYAVADSEFFGDCQGLASDPIGTIVTVTYEDTNGNTCLQSRTLSPTENNNKGNGKQFYQLLWNPFGDLEVKFGEIGGVDGILAIYTSNANINITQLDLNYDLTIEKITLESGSISIGDNKTSKIILAQE